MPLGIPKQWTPPSHTISLLSTVNRSPQLEYIDDVLRGHDLNNQMVYAVKFICLKFNLCFIDYIDSGFFGSVFMVEQNSYIYALKIALPMSGWQYTPIETTLTMLSSLPSTHITGRPICYFVTHETINYPVNYNIDSDINNEHNNELNEILSTTSSLSSSLSTASTQSTTISITSQTPPPNTIPLFVSAALLSYVPGLDLGKFTELNLKHQYAALIQSSKSSSSLSLSSPLPPPPLSISTATPPIPSQQEYLRLNYNKIQFLTSKTIQLMTAQLLLVTLCCHQKGIVHRDIKPSNILLVPQQYSPRFQGLISQNDSTCNNYIDQRVLQDDITNNDKNELNQKKQNISIFTNTSTNHQPHFDNQGNNILNNTNVHNRTHRDLSRLISSDIKNYFYNHHNHANDDINPTHFPLIQLLDFGIGILPLSELNFDAFCMNNNDILDSLYYFQQVQALKQGITIDNKCTITTDDSINKKIDDVNINDPKNDNDELNQSKNETLIPRLTFPQLNAFQKRDAADCSLDIYAIGLTMLELLTGFIPGSKATTEYLLESSRTTCQDHTNIQELPTKQRDIYKFVRKGKMDSILKEYDYYYHQMVTSSSATTTVTNTMTPTTTNTITTTDNKDSAGHINAHNNENMNTTLYKRIFTPEMIQTFNYLLDEDPIERYKALYTPWIQDVLPVVLHQFDYAMHHGAPDVNNNDSNNNNNNNTITCDLSTNNGVQTPIRDNINNGNDYNGKVIDHIDTSNNIHTNHHHNSSTVINNQFNITLPSYSSIKTLLPPYPAIVSDNSDDDTDRIDPLDSLFDLSYQQFLVQPNIAQQILQFSPPKTPLAVSSSQLSTALVQNHAGISSSSSSPPPLSSSSSSGVNGNDITSLSIPFINSYNDTGSHLPKHIRDQSLLNSLRDTLYTILLFQSATEQLFQWQKSPLHTKKSNHNQTTTLSLLSSNINNNSNNNIENAIIPCKYLQFTIYNPFYLRALPKQLMSPAQPKTVLSCTPPSIPLLLSSRARPIRPSPPTKTASTSSLFSLTEHGRTDHSGKTNGAKVIYRQPNIEMYKDDKNQNIKTKDSSSTNPCTTTTIITNTSISDPSTTHSATTETNLSSMKPLLSPTLNNSVVLLSNLSSDNKRTIHKSTHDLFHDISTLNDSCGNELLDQKTQHHDQNGNEIEKKKEVRKDTKSKLMVNLHDNNNTPIETDTLQRIVLSFLLGTYTPLPLNYDVPQRYEVPNHLQ